MIARLDEDGRIVSYDALVTSPPHSTRPAGSEEPNLRAQQFLPHAMSMGPGNDAPQPQGGADRNAVPGYAIPAVRVVRKRPAYVPYRPSAMRGLGAFTNVIALEQLMESCAEAAVQDSIAYRLSHLEDPRAIAVIETVRDMVGPRHDAEDVGYGLGYAQYKNSAGYLACIARVVVGDEVRVTDVWSAADVGEAISPDGTINQIEGGIVQAISWVLKEEVTFAGGQNLTKSWDDYPILRFSEVPRMKTRLIGPQDAPPLGAGEISSGPAGAAVVNAVRHVLGVVPDRLPLSRHALVTMLS
jgi:nicotinate dehydrogenase subunit B